MDVRIDTTKTIEENANFYYEKAKKAKKKLESLKHAIELTKVKLSSMQNEEEKPKEQKKFLEPPQKKWYMKFRWFISSDGFLCIGGNDATSNEIIVKKHTDKGDLLFHTDIKGSPFFVVKAEGKEIPKHTMEEAAQATASFSKAWNQGASTTEVYAIAPDQVKKELGLPKGTFMIYGKRTYFRPVIKLYIGVDQERNLICTPVETDFLLKQEGKRTDTAKLIQKKLLEKYNIKYPIDDIVMALPGDCSV